MLNPDPIDKKGKEQETGPYCNMQTDIEQFVPIELF
jgi:hypothetical protein